MLDKLKKKFRIDFSKNTKFLFYLKGFGVYLTPKVFYKKDFESLYNSLSNEEKEYIDSRVNYYNKLDDAFSLEDSGVTIKEFVHKEKKKTYYFDLLEFAKYFDYAKKIFYLFGDIVEVPTKPAIVKSRPIDGDNKNSIVMKLNKVRHFIFVDDNKTFEEKIDKAVWRGKCYREHRKKFVEQFYNSELCNIGQTNTKGEMNVPWQKGKLSLEEQLGYKFLIAIEGNDVASNLKWAMSSNSLVMMAKPKFETWFMEGTLEAGKHYVLLNDDYSDLEEKIEYYSDHLDEAKSIIQNANDYVEQFKNKEFEDLISYFVLKKYLIMSKQINLLKESIN